MRMEFTKSFLFSASYSKQGRCVGCNFTLDITTGPLDEARRAEFETMIQRELISKVHTQDFDSVDFLKDAEKTDAGILRAIYTRLTSFLTDYRPVRLALATDSRTVTTLTLD